MDWKRILLCGCLIFLFGASMVTPRDAGAQDEATFDLRVNSDYHLNQDGRPTPSYDFLVPLYSDDESLLFFNPRYHIDSETNLNRAEEWNLGLGYRRMVFGDRAIVGANVYYDWRRSEYGNESEQIGAGLELLTERWEARVNGYLSLSGPAEVTSHRELYLGERGIYFTDWATYEVPMSGMDGEIGFKVPYLSDYVETWVYGGGYYFTADLTRDNPGISRDMVGYSGRVEVKPTDYLKLDFVVRDDNIRGTDYYGSVNVQVPFSIENLIAGKNPFAGLKEKVVEKEYEVALADRMYDKVVRDPDIITDYNPANEKAKNNGVWMLMKYVDNTYGGTSTGSWTQPYKTIAEGLAALTPTTQVLFVTDKGELPYDGFNVTKASTTIWGQGYDCGIGLPHSGEISLNYPEVTGLVTIAAAATKVEIMGLSFDNPTGTGIEVTGTLANIHHNQFNNKIGVNLKGVVGNTKIQYNTLTVNGTSGGAYGIYSDTPGKNLGTSMTAPLLITNNTFSVTNTGTAAGDLAAGIFLKSTKSGSAGGTIYTKIQDNTLAVSSDAGEAYGVYEDAAVKLYTNVSSNDMGGGIHGELVARGVYLKALGGFVGTTALPLTVSGNTLTVTSDTMDAAGISLVSDNASAGTACSTKVQYNNFVIDGASGGVYGVYSSVMGKNLGTSMTAPLLITNNTFSVANTGMAAGDCAAGIYLKSTKVGAAGGIIYTKIMDNALAVSSSGGEAYGVFEEAAAKLYTNITGNNMGGGVHGELMASGVYLKTLTGSMGTAALPVTITGNTLTVTSDTLDAAGVFSISDKALGGTVGNLANTGGSFSITAPRNVYGVIDAEAVKDLTKLNAAITSGRGFIFVKAGTYTGAINTVNRAVNLWGEGMWMFGMGSSSYSVLNNSLTLNATGAAAMGLDMRGGITVSGGTGTVVSYNMFSVPGNGLTLSGGTGAVVEGNLFTLSGPASTGVLVSGGTGATILSNYFNGEGIGVSVASGSATLNGNFFTLTGTGVKLYSGTSGDVSDYNIFDVSGTGISVLGGTRTISGNEFSGDGTGISLADGATDITGSNLFSLTGTGIKISGGSGTIANNGFSCTGTGIARSDGGYAINANDFDVLGTGIKVSGGSGVISDNEFDGTGTAVALAGGSSTVNGSNYFALTGTGVSILTGASGTVSGNTFFVAGKGINISGGDAMITGNGFGGDSTTGICLESGSATINGGNNFALTGTGIRLAGGTGTISGNTFSATGDGIYVAGGTGSIDGNTFNVATNGIRYASGSGLYIGLTAANTFNLTDASGVGILASGGNNASIANNAFTGTGTGVSITGGTANINGNGFTLTGTGIKLLGGTGTITGNTFTGTGTGVSLSGGSGTTINGNNAFTLYGTGINIGNASNTTVSGNTFTITGASNAGIALSGSPAGLTVSGNTIDSQGYGVYADITGSLGTTGSPLSFTGNTITVDGTGLDTEAAGIYLKSGESIYATITGNDMSGGITGDLLTYGALLKATNGTVNSTVTNNDADVWSNTLDAAGIFAMGDTISGTYSEGTGSFTVNGAREHYGVIDAEVVDDVSELNTAITSGTMKWIYIEDGAYAGAIDTVNRSVSLWGEGLDMYGMGSSGRPVFGSTLTLNASDVSAMGLGFDYSDAFTTTGIVVSGGSGVDILSNTFAGSGTGISITGGSDIAIGDGTTAHKNTLTLNGTGIAIGGGTTGITVNANDISVTGAGVSGINLGANVPVSILNNTISSDYCGIHAYVTGALTTGTISGNTIVVDGTGLADYAYGIRLYTYSALLALNTSISGNAISVTGDNLTYGIQCNAANTGQIGAAGTPASIDGNAVTVHSNNNGAFGINLTAGSDIFSEIQSNDLSGGITRTYGSGSCYGIYNNSTNGDIAADISDNDDMSVVNENGDAYGIYLSGHGISGNANNNGDMYVCGRTLYAVFVASTVDTIGNLGTNTPFEAGNNQGTLCGGTMYGVRVNTASPGVGNYLSCPGLWFFPVIGNITGNYGTGSYVYENFSGPPWTTDLISP